MRKLYLASFKYKVKEDKHGVTDLNEIHQENQLVVVSNKDRENVDDSVIQQASSNDELDLAIAYLKCQKWFEQTNMNSKLLVLMVNPTIQ